MSLQSVINRNLTQNAVYWGNPRNNGSGGYTFDAPVDINCRWEEKDQLFLTEGTGLTLSSRSVVFVGQDLDEEGYLWFGSVADLTDLQKANPKKVVGAASIKKFEKIPVLHSTTEFLRVARLTPLLT